MGSAEEVRVYRQELTDYVNILRENADDSKIDELAKLRNMDAQVFRDAGLFFIDKQAEMLVPEYIDKVRDFGVIAVNGKPIYNERYVIPIYDTSGLVMAMVGYKYGVTERYMYATTKYFNRGDAMYGLENFVEATNAGYGIIAEGIMDALRLRSFGIKYAFSTCGADKSWDRMLNFDLLKRCIFFHDNDRAGKLTEKHWHSDTELRFIIPKPFKDIDEFARQNDTTLEYCKDLVLGAVDYINKTMVPGQRERIFLEEVVEVELEDFVAVRVKQQQSNKMYRA